MIRYKKCTTDSAALIHKCDPCDETELGRVRGVALVQPGTAISVPYNKQEWESLIESGAIIIIPRTTGSTDGGAAVYGPGYGDEDQRKIADEHTLSFKDPAYKQNTAFWQAAEKKTWNLLYRTETQLVYVKDKVRLTAKAPVEEDLTSEVVWNVEAKWKGKNKPVNSDLEPVAEFFECFEVGSASSSSSASSSAAGSSAAQE